LLAGVAIAATVQFIVGSVATGLCKRIFSKVKPAPAAPAPVPVRASSLSMTADIQSKLKAGFKLAATINHVPATPSTSAVTMDAEEATTPSPAATLDRKASAVVYSPLSQNIPNEDSPLAEASTAFGPN
jgi:hypothetical protein